MNDRTIVKNLIDGYYSLLKIVLTMLMGIIIVPVSLQILSRYTGIVPRYIWTEEMARFCFIWIIMIGSMIAVRDRSHFDVVLRTKPSSSKSEGFRRLFVHVAMCFFALLFVRYGIDFARFGLLQNSEMSGINMVSIFIAFPLAGATWVLFLLEHMTVDLKLIQETDEESPA